MVAKMKRYLLLLLVMVAGQSYAAGDCKMKDIDGSDRKFEGTYTGECKNGYAEGKGVYEDSWSTRSGEERYVYFKGDWKDGRKWGIVYFDSHNENSNGIYINDWLIKECAIGECDPYDSLDLDEKTKENIMMSKITTAIKGERYKDALVYFISLEKHSNNLPESFYFYQIQTLLNAADSGGHSMGVGNALRQAVSIKAKEYLKKYGSKGKYYAEVVEIMGR